MATDKIKKPATKKEVKKSAPKKAAPKKASASLATAKKAAPKKAAPKKAAPKKAAPKKASARKSAPEASFNDQATPGVSGVSEFLSQAAGVFDAAGKALPGVVAKAEQQARVAYGVASETAKAVGQEAATQAAEFSRVATEQLERGKAFVKKHPNGAIASALATAAVAGLAAGRATFKSERRHK